MKIHSLALLIACAFASGCAQHPQSFALEKALIHEHNAEVPVASVDQFPKHPVRFFTRNREGFQAIREQQYRSALNVFVESTQEYGDDGDLWRARALCEEKTGHRDLAIASYQKALALGVTPWDTPLPHIENPNDIEMQIARLYALQGDKPQALLWIRRSLDTRFDERPSVIEDPAFASLRSEPEFIQWFQLDAKTKPSRVERWRADIEFMRREIATLHANPDHRHSADQLDQQFKQLKVQVPDLTDEQIMATMTAIVGALGAGHDIFWPVFATHGAMKPFAIKFYLFSDGLFIIDAYDPSLLGAKVLSFNDTSAEKAYAKIRQAFPGDNEMEARWQAARHFAQAYTLEHLGIIKSALDVHIQILDAQGLERSITPERRAFTAFSPALTTPKVSEAFKSHVPLYLSRLDTHFWMQELPEQKSLYVQLINVQNSKDESLAQFAERVAKQSRQSSIDHLILDLRHSPGGNGYLTPPLMRALIAFSENPEKQNLFIIIGRNTFSASQNLITDLDWISDPIFVGEPSGSSPNAYSESGQIKLPFSGASLTISSQLHQHSWPEDERYWIAPDIPVALSSKDFFQGRDPAMEAIIEFLISGSEEKNTS